MKDTLIILLIAYFLGNIQTSYLIGRYFKKTDIREHGSGNAGTTNALRVFGKNIAIVTLIVDVLKGVLAVYIGGRIAGSGGELLAGVAVVIGHNWPFYLKFRGGKGVATSIGVALMITPIAALLAIVAGIIIIARTKYVSLGSISAIVLWPIFNIIIEREFDRQFIVFGLILIIMLIYKHKENVNRLINGTENKIGQKKS